MYGCHEEIERLHTVCEGKYVGRMWSRVAYDSGGT
jgi:hypothetical protein